MATYGKGKLGPLRDEELKKEMQPVRSRSSLRCRFAARAVKS